MAKPHLPRLRPTNNPKTRFIFKKRLWYYILEENQRDNE